MQFIQGLTRTFDAGGSVNDMKVVRLSATEDNTVHHDTSATTVPVGVTQHSASDGENVTVAINGTVKVIASAQIVKGARLKADESGKVRTTTTANNAVVGIALNSTTQTVTTGGTEVIEMDMTPRGSNF